MVKLAGKAVWYCVVLEMGKEWESSCVSGWLRLRITGETGLERQHGREEDLQHPVGRINVF